MRKAAPIMAAISLSMCLSLPPQKANTASQNRPIDNSSFPSSTIQDQLGIGNFDVMIGGLSAGFTLK